MGGCFLLVVAVILVLVIIGYITTPDDTGGTDALSCLQDLDCIKNNRGWMISAEISCAKAIEREAPWGYEWTNKWPSKKFHSVGQGSTWIFRVVGDQIRFQNAFGAWRQMEYICWYRPKSETVESVRVY